MAQHNDVLPALKLAVMVGPGMVPIQRGMNGKEVEIFPRELRGTISADMPMGELDTPAPVWQAVREGERVDQGMLETQLLDWKILEKPKGRRGYVLETVIESTYDCSLIKPFSLVAPRPAARRRATSLG